MGHQVGQDAKDIESPRYDNHKLKSSGWRKWVAIIGIPIALSSWMFWKKPEVKHAPQDTKSISVELNVKKDVKEIERIVSGQIDELISEGKRIIRESGPGGKSKGLRDFPSLQNHFNTSIKPTIESLKNTIFGKKNEKLTIITKQDAKEIEASVLALMSKVKDAEQFISAGESLRFLNNLAIDLENIK